MLIGGSARWKRGRDVLMLTSVIVLCQISLDMG